VVIDIGGIVDHYCFNFLFIILYFFFLHGHYPNATFQPSISDCKLNSHHENIKNVYSWNTVYLTLKK
jgi:hypothetical protein